MHGNDCEDDFKGMLESIRQSEKKIVEYKEQVQLIKGVVRCEKCGGEVSINSAFVTRAVHLCLNEYLFRHMMKIQ